MRSATRRGFLGSSLAAGAGLISAGPAIRGATKGYDDYKTVLIGAGWWGTNIVREAVRSGHCRVAAVCDVDRLQAEKCVAEIQKMGRDAPRIYSDFREVLATEKPEIAIVATPDHWHPLITIAAVRAGAHVYVEKPIGHTINEGKAMVAAARETGKMVQVGMHRRVSPHNLEGMKFLKSGKAGKIGMVRAFVHYGGGFEEPEDNQEPPATLDWNLWCGPGPLRPFNPKIHPKGFRNFLDFANGTLGDWGIHWMDQILWWTDELAPRKVYSTGGRPIAGPPINDGKRQTSDAPDHQVTTFEFEGFTATWEHRKFAGNSAEKTHPDQAVGCYFYGTEGTFHMGWLDGWTFYPADPRKAPLHMDAQLNQPDDQNISGLWADLLDAIKTGRRPVCDIEIGHRSTSMALLGMLALRVDRALAWDSQAELVSGDSQANDLLKREYRGPWTYPGTQ